MRMNLRTVLASVLLITAVPVSAADTAQQVAGKAVSQLTQEMRKKLTESIMKNGPAGAIDVCAKEAPQIVSRIERELEVSIKRTSLNVRNPRNAPDQEEKELLKKLELSHKAGGTLPTGVTSFPDNHRRFYKTIAMEQVCLKCHGDITTMSDQVRKAIAASYPDDKAIGYKEGDLRGIISVTVK